MMKLDDHVATSGPANIWDWSLLMKKTKISARNSWFMGCHR